MAEGWESQGNGNCTVNIYKELGKAYMCQRKRKEAFEQLEKYTEKTNDECIHQDIGHAYLGLTETTKSIAAYNAAFSVPSLTKHALSAGYVHVINKDYTKAISLFESAVISEDNTAPSGINSGEDYDATAQVIFSLHLQLGLCYKAVDHPGDMKRNFKAAVKTLKLIIKQVDKTKAGIWSTVVTHGHISTLGLWRKSSVARQTPKTLEHAMFLFEKTTFEDDDEIQKSEAEEATAALARLSWKGGGYEADSVPGLKEITSKYEAVEKLLLPYTTGWYCSQSCEPPRKRGTRDWNDISFVNKFIVRHGHRTFVAPWGFQHT